jgi:hypothetical protein
VWVYLGLKLIQHLFIGLIFSGPLKKVSWPSVGAKAPTTRNAELTKCISYLFMFLVESLPFLQRLLDFKLKQIKK